MDTNKLVRVVLGLASALALAVFFIFQSFNLAALLQLTDSPINQFVINRIFRFLFNDLFAIGIIYSLFPRRRYVMFAVVVQLTGMVCLLIPYLIVKLNYPQYNGPLINFVHRLILNPTLLMLLIPAFYFQEGLRTKGGPNS